jgi:hypothetical protein
MVMQHALYTGPIQGLLTLNDGTVVNVNPDVIEVANQEQADEISFLIGEHWVANGHPHDVEEDEDGNPVQRPFVHVHHAKFNKHPGKYKGKPAGRPHTEKG